MLDGAQPCENKIKNQKKKPRKITKNGLNLGLFRNVDPLCGKVKKTTDGKTSKGFYILFHIAKRIAVDQSTNYVLSGFIRDMWAVSIHVNVFLSLPPFTQYLLYQFFSHHTSFWIKKNWENLNESIFSNKFSDKQKNS